MKKEYHESVIKAAKVFGIPPEKLMADIEQAMENAQKSDDPKVQERWKSIPCKGEKPTADELINFMSLLITANKLKS